jgi:DMSO/TMAO reductase YedYZ heme-binding membrane subunit
MQRLTGWLQQLQRYLTPRQKTVIRGFVIVEIALLLLGALIAYQSVANPVMFAPVMSQSGARLGQIAVLLFCLTLFPGIFQRFRWNTPLSLPVLSLLILFRRHLGILMFLTALVHQVFNSTVPNFIFFGSPVPPTGFPTFVVLGIISWLLLFPVWLTSNDISQRMLGKKWKMLQRLTYGAIWFIFAHVALQGEWLAVLIALTALLEFGSWVKAGKRNGGLN